MNNGSLFHRKSVVQHNILTWFLIYDWLIKWHFVVLCYDKNIFYRVCFQPNILGHLGPAELALKHECFYTILFFYCQSIIFNILFWLLLIFVLLTFSTKICIAVHESALYVNVIYTYIHKATKFGKLSATVSRKVV